MFKISNALRFSSIALLFLFSCQPNDNRKEILPQTSKHLTYPKIIDSLKFNSFYDSARWYIYTTYCDQLYLPKSDSSKSFTFGELPLKFEDLVNRNDTLELHFWFTQNDQIILPSMTRDFRQLLTGVGFNKVTKKKIYMWSPSGFTVWTKGGSNNRFEQPLQPEVLNYISKNNSRIDSNFRLLAQLKGIFK